jgi:hypothetical protein
LLSIALLCASPSTSFSKPFSLRIPCCFAPRQMDRRFLNTVSGRAQKQ